MANSTATSDQVVLDCFDSLPKTIGFMYWINTASPLSTVQDIQQINNQQLKLNSRSIVSARKTRGHLIYKENPLNFSYDSGFERTQDLNHALELNYAIMGWHRDPKPDLQKGQLYNKQTDYFISSWQSNLLLKDQHDLELIQALCTLRGIE